MLAADSIVHYDLKAANVLVELLPGASDAQLHGEPPGPPCLPCFRPVLADFGEARAYDSVGEAFTARNRCGPRAVCAHRRVQVHARCRVFMCVHVGMKMPRVLLWPRGPCMRLWNLGAPQRASCASCPRQRCGALTWEAMCRPHQRGCLQKALLQAALLEQLSALWAC